MGYPVTMSVLETAFSFQSCGALAPKIDPPFAFVASEGCPFQGPSCRAMRRLVSTHARVKNSFGIYVFPFFQVGRLIGPREEDFVTLCLASLPL